METRSGNSTRGSDVQAIRAFCEAFISSFNVTEETAKNVTVARISEIASVSEVNYSILQHLAVQGEHICEVLESSTPLPAPLSPEGEQMTISNIVKLVRLHLPHIKKYIASQENVQDNEVSSTDGPPPTSVTAADAVDTAVSTPKQDAGTEGPKSSSKRDGNFTTNSSNRGQELNSDSRQQSQSQMSLSASSTNDRQHLPPQSSSIPEHGGGPSHRQSDVGASQAAQLSVEHGRSPHDVPLLSSNQSKEPHRVPTVHALFSTPGFVPTHTFLSSVASVPGPQSVQTFNSGSPLSVASSLSTPKTQQLPPVSPAIMSSSLVSQELSSPQAAPGGFLKLHSCSKSSTAGIVTQQPQPVLPRGIPMHQSRTSPPMTNLCHVQSYPSIAPLQPGKSPSSGFQVIPLPHTQYQEGIPQQQTSTPMILPIQQYQSPLLSVRQSQQPLSSSNAVSKYRIPCPAQIFKPSSAPTPFTTVPTLPAVRVLHPPPTILSHMKNLLSRTPSVSRKPLSVTQGGYTSATHPGCEHDGLNTIAVSTSVPVPLYVQTRTTPKTTGDDTLSTCSNKAISTHPSITTPHVHAGSVDIKADTSSSKSLSQFSSQSSSLSSRYVSGSDNGDSGPILTSKPQTADSDEEWVEDVAASISEKLQRYDQVDVPVPKSLNQEQLIVNSVPLYRKKKVHAFLFSLSEGFFFPLGEENHNTTNGSRAIHSSTINIQNFDHKSDSLPAVTPGSQQQSQCSLNPTMLPGLPMTEVSSRSGDDYVSSRDTTPSLGDSDLLMEVDSGQQQPTTTSKAKGKSSQVHKIPAVGAQVLAKFGQGEKSRWKEAVVQSHRAGRRKGERRYIVRVDDKLHEKELHRLAMIDTVDVSEVPVKTRIIAWYGAMDYLFSGVVAEPPVEENGYRILVFFDDGFAQYVTLDKVHLVYQKNIALDKQYSSMHQFLKLYFNSHPKHLKLRAKQGDILDVERHGDILKAEVEQIDCNLMKLKFDDMNGKVSYEWLYRGNFRLLPIYEETQRRKGKPITPRLPEEMFNDDLFDAHCPPLPSVSDNTGIHYSQTSISSVASPSSLPQTDYVEVFESLSEVDSATVSRTEGDVPMYCNPVEWSVSSGVSDSDSSLRMTLMRKRPQLTDHKGASRKRVKSLSSPLPSTEDDDGDFEEESLRPVAPRRSLSTGDKHVCPLQGAPAKCGNSRSVSPTSVQNDHSGSDTTLLEYNHMCSEECRGDATLPPNYQLYHCLAFPLMLNWKRSVESVARIGNTSTRKPFYHVYYLSPCGRRLRNMEEIKRHLHSIKENQLSLDMFCFDASISVSLSPMERNENALYYLDDISNGQEFIPIPCVNELDQSSPPPFEYITSRKWGEDVTLDTSPDFMLSCLCKDDCQDPTKCSCLKLTVNEFQLSKPNDLMNPTKKEKLGYQYNRLNLEKITALYECNKYCSCSSSCGNRVVQTGLMPRLEVFKTEDRGWGVRCLDDIPQGTFVAHYCGTLLSDTAVEELAKLGSHTDTYLVDLDYVDVVERYKTTDVIDDESLEPPDPLDNTFLGETSSPNSDNDHTWEELPQCSDEALTVRPDVPKTRNRSKKSREDSTQSTDGVEHNTAAQLEPEERKVPQDIHVGQDSVDMGVNKKPAEGDQQPSSAQCPDLFSCNDDEDDLPVFDLTNLSTRSNQVDPSPSHVASVNRDMTSSTEPGVSQGAVPKDKQPDTSPALPKKKNSTIESYFVKVERDPNTCQSACSQVETLKPDSELPGSTSNPKHSCGSRSDPICLSDSDDSVFGEEGAITSMPSMMGLNLSHEVSRVSSWTSARTSLNVSNDTRSSPDQQKLFTIDASVCGNVARFFNHSCMPNMFVKNVFVDTQDYRFTWVALFTKYNVKARTELTWDYNYTPGSIQGRMIECKCGADNCRGRLL